MGSFVPFQDDLGSYIARLEARIRNLENTPAAGYQAIAEGAMVVLNGSGDPEVVVGLQADGRYGLSVANASGVLQQVGGTLAQVGANVLAQTGSFASPQSLSTSITAIVGPSHQAVVTWSAGVEFHTATQANIELQLDGTRITSFGGSSIAALTAYLGSGAQEGTVGRTVLLDCGTQGGHTFSLKCWDPGGATFDALHPVLVVQPL